MGRRVYVSIMIVGWILLFMGGQSDGGKRDVKKSRIYEGTWHGTYMGRDTSLEMTISIDPGGEISWKINGKELDHVEYEYVYSKFPNTTPFLCVYTQEGDKEHLFHGIFSVYEEIPPSHNQIRGVYKIVYPCQFGGKPGICAQGFDVDLHGPPLDDGR